MRDDNKYNALNSSTDIKGNDTKWMEHTEFRLYPLIGDGVEKKFLYAPDGIFQV